MLVKLTFRSYESGRSWYCSHLQWTVRLGFTCGCWEFSTTATVWIFLCVEMELWRRSWVSVIHFIEGKRSLDILLELNFAIWGTVGGVTIRIAIFRLRFFVLSSFETIRFISSTYCGRIAYFRSFLILDIVNYRFILITLGQPN